MAERKSMDSETVNQFILFYTLRFLWKLNKHSVGELYEALFPSKKGTGGNKTLYDNILRGQVTFKTMSGHAKRLEELTGLNKKYFTGEYELSIPCLINEDWREFIKLRRKPETTEGDKLKEIEGKIKRRIQDARNHQSDSKEPLRRLMYFAEYGHKRADKTLEDLFREIESMIEECHPKLEKHQKAIQEHLYHIAAVVTVRKWKDTGKQEV